MRTREQQHRQRRCRLPEQGVPGCGTGPAGRLRFVARELADLARGLRGRDTEAAAGGDEREGEAR